MTVSRVSFDPTKNYLEVQFNENVSLLDSELNEVQKITRFFEMDASQKLLGASVLGEDWLVFPSANTNAIMVKAGTFFFKGYQFVLYQDTEITGLSTPGANRTDTVYVLYQETVVTSLEDPNILDPNVGAPTTQRIQLSFQIYVAEGESSPPVTGYSYFQIGTLNRLAGNPNVTSGMIQDDRSLLVNTYVLNGLQVVQGIGGPFNVLVNPGSAVVAGQNVDILSSPPEITLSPNTVTSLILQTSGLGVFPQVDLPTTFQVVLAQVVTNASGIVGLQTQNGVTTAGSLAVSALSDTSGMAQGQLVFGTGILLGTYVAEIVDAMDVLLSQPADFTGINALTFSGGIIDQRLFKPLVQIASGMGSQGATGVQGQTGIQGNTGVQGVQGFTGIQGFTGVQGIQGNTGVQGYTGLQGNTGVQGITGFSGIVPAQALTESVGSVTIDWSLGNVFTLTLNANATVVFNNQASGQSIVVRFTNISPNAYTVTWPTVYWTAGVAPTMTSGASGTVSDVYTFIFDGTNIYGAAVQNMSP